MKYKTFEMEGIKIYYETLDFDMNLTVFMIGYMDFINSSKATDFLIDIPFSVKGIHKIILNMEKTTYISSTGIGVFTTLLITCKKIGIKLEIINLSRKIFDVIDLLGFSSYFNIRGIT